MNSAARLDEPPKFDSRLKPCPFCGGPAVIEYWHGGKPTKRMVSCFSEQCPVQPSVTEETYREALDAWNERAVT